MGAYGFLHLENILTFVKVISFLGKILLVLFSDDIRIDYRE